MNINLTLHNTKKYLNLHLRVFSRHFTPLALPIELRDTGAGGGRWGSANHFGHKSTFYL